jgi:hypothetical protein
MSILKTNQGGTLNRGCFHSLNAGKYGISLNLGSGRVKRYSGVVKISDVVIENSPQG